jgi:hypothetical protein
MNMAKTITANLSERNKRHLREYWSQLFGEDYVNALLADKETKKIIKKEPIKEKINSRYEILDID